MKIKVFDEENSIKNAFDKKHSKEVFDIKMPKPIFKPSVQTVVCSEVKHAINKVITYLKLDDFHITDVEISRINGLKDTIRLDESGLISDWGSAASYASEQIINDLSAIIKNGSIDNVRFHLNNIYDIVKCFNVDSLKEEESFISRFLTRKKKINFKDVENDLNTEIVRCNVALEQIKNIHTVFTEMFDKNEAQFRKLTIYIVSGFMFLDNKKQEIELFDMSKLDFFGKQRISDTFENMNRFERRLNVLTQLRYNVLLRIAQLKLEQKNIFMLIDTVSEVLTLLIPSWRQQMLTISSISKTAISYDMYDSVDSLQKRLIEKITNPTSVVNIDTVLNPPRKR